MEQDKDDCQSMNC